MRDRIENCLFIFKNISQFWTSRLILECGTVTYGFELITASELGFGFFFWGGGVSPGVGLLVPWSSPVQLLHVSWPAPARNPGTIRICRNMIVRQSVESYKKLYNFFKITGAVQEDYKLFTYAKAYIYVKLISFHICTDLTFLSCHLTLECSFWFAQNK